MTFKTELLPYQKQAVDKLINIRVGALYMEMGTGKTRTALEMIKTRLDSGKIKHVLWLCPCSVKQNLREDIQKHANGALANIAIAGIESLSSSINLYNALMDYVASGVTMLIVDESLLVKNPFANRTKRITNLAEKCRYRLILNGTPISRNEIDLFSQWYILDWRILGYRSYYSFSANHIEYDPEIPGKIRRVLNRDYLVEKIAPYSFQISKKDCLTLPDKHYFVCHCNMTKAQAEHYYNVVDRMIDEIDEMRPETIYRMFSAAQAIISGLYVEEDSHHSYTRPMFEKPDDNPRMSAFRDVLTDECTVIFCKFTHEIDGITEMLNRRESGCARQFYGKMSPKARQQAIADFKQGKFKYLVANKTCAGFGLNLQNCHNVIFFSNDFDYATRIQAEDRVHRIGQNHEISITDMVTPYTLDEKIIECLNRKEGLSENIKREINRNNGNRSAKDKFRKWLHGEMEDADGKAVSE